MLDWCNIVARNHSFAAQIQNKYCMIVDQNYRQVVSRYDNNSFLTGIDLVKCNIKFKIITIALV